MAPEPGSKLLKTLYFGTQDFAPGPIKLIKATFSVTLVPMEEYPSVIGQETPEKRAVDLWNEEDSRSLLSVMSKQLVKATLAAREHNPALFEMCEEELAQEMKKFGTGGARANLAENRLRMSFWQQYDKVMTLPNVKDIKAGDVYAGVCTLQFFYGKFMKSPVKVAWMLCPPANYVTLLEESLNHGMTQLRRYLAVDAIDSKGKLDVRTAEFQAKVVKMMDDRLKGGIIQRVEQKTFQMNYHKGIPGEIIQTMDMEQLKRRLEHLKSKDRMGADGAKEITVEGGEIKDSHEESDEKKSTRQSLGDDTEPQDKT